MITCYISHAIQGRYGRKATPAQMDANNQRAIDFVYQLRVEFGEEIDFYVPAEHEDFVNRAYKMGLLSIDEILVIDCDIVRSKDILLLYIPDSYVSSGMLKEAHKAKCLGKTILQVNNDNWKQIIQEYLDEIQSTH